MSLVTHDQLMFGPGRFRFGKQGESRSLHAPAMASRPTGQPEIRFRVRELRAEKRGEETYLTGYAANYGVLSEDLGGWKERIVPGAFSRALKEDHDVRHLQNHDPNLVLGRTRAGTTVLREDAKGLAFETHLGNRSYERDLAESVARGDVDEMSFGFIARKESWAEERDADSKKKIDVRELRDLDLVDISTVTYPAYPGTSAGIDSRALFPDGAPVELRSRLGTRKPGATEPRARLTALPGVERRAVELRSAQSAGVFELMIYDDIGASWFSEGITAKSLKAKLDHADAPYSTIRLRINSLGGDMFEGIAIFNMLRAQEKQIECCIDGVACSAASLIAMAGDKITMGIGALMMIHRSASFAHGNCGDMRDLADLLETFDGAGAEIYAARTGRPAAELLAMMDAETWMSGQDCLDKGFCTALGAVKDSGTVEAAACGCSCAACVDGRCEDCGNAECEDPNCEGCPMQAEELMAEAASRSSHLLASFRNAPEKLKKAAVRTKDSGDVERRMRLRLAKSL